MNFFNYVNCDLEEYVLSDGKIFGQCKFEEGRIVIWSFYVRFALNNIFYVISINLI